MEVLVVVVTNPSNEQSRSEQTRDQPCSIVKKLHDFSKYNKTKDCLGKLRDTILVISIKIKIIEKLCLGFLNKHYPPATIPQRNSTFTTRYKMNL